MFLVENQTNERSGLPQFEDQSCSRRFSVQGGLCYPFFLIGALTCEIYNVMVSYLCLKYMPGRLNALPLASLCSVQSWIEVPATLDKRVLCSEKTKLCIVWFKILYHMKNVFTMLTISACSSV